MAAKQDTRPYQLIDLFVLVYQTKYGKKPTVNKYRDRWGFTDMIDSIGYERSVEVVKYFLSIDRPTHTLVWLFNNFDRLDEQIKVRDEDRKRRAKMLSETKKRVEGGS